MAKLDRRNQARQRQLTKHREHQQETSVFAGRDGAPRIVAVIPLCSDGDAAVAVKKLNESVDIEAEVTGQTSRVPVERFKQSIQYIPLRRDLAACLDAARVADFVVVILSPEVEVDELGELILRSVENQGMSTMFTVVQGLDKIEPAKQKSQVLLSLKSYITHFHSEQEKLYSLDSRQECSNLMRSLCCSTPQGIRWRDERSWMLVDSIRWPENDGEEAVLTGVVRGRGLNADRLVQIGDWGTFQIDKITAAPISTKRKKAGDMAVDEPEIETILQTPTEDRDDPANLAPEDAIVEDVDEAAATASIATTVKKGVLLDDHHYFSEEEQEVYALPKKLPKGTSNYQATWFLDDVASDSGEDEDDEEMKDADVADDAAQPEDGIEGHVDEGMTEAGPSEYPQSEVFEELEEEDDAAQLEAYRARKHGEVEDDMEFPDEIELGATTLARERLARYRGLKSLRTSPWNEEEDKAFEPEEWTRLLQIPNYPASKAKSTNEALAGGVKPGTRVNVYIRGVPQTVRAESQPSHPITLFSLLRHENKWTAANYLVNLPSDYPTSIKSKEELVVQCGFRRFVINPLFSQPGSTENDVHKYCRYLHPGQSVYATFMGPVTWGPVPLLFFKKAETANSAVHKDTSLPLTLVATGTALPPSTSRVIAKRVILTGHPYHIHKKVVTIRYMFFNREDVHWFKALPLWTKRGRGGYIKEALGTHGYFKATFDGMINPQDSIGISLYKRVWPRPSRPFTEALLRAGSEAQPDGSQMDVHEDMNDNVLPA